MHKITSGKSLSLAALALEHYNLLNPQTKNGSFNLKESISGKIRNIIDKNTVEFQTYFPLLEFLEKNMKDILIGDPFLLMYIDYWIKSICTDNNINLNDEVLQNLLKNRLFNYDSFRDKYGANLILELGLIVCPYCNLNYMRVITVKNKETKEKKDKFPGDFDHFYTQSRFPYFALSFYNLIPCCSYCNSRLKHAGSFNMDEYMHPYFDCLNDALIFRTGILNSDFFFNPKDKFKIKLKRNLNKGVSDSDYTKAKKTAKAFKLKLLVNTHKDIIIELVQKFIAYNQEYVNQLFVEYEGTLFSSKEEVYKMLLGNYITDEELGKRPMAKLFKDVAEEFGLIQSI